MDTWLIFLSHLHFFVQYDEETSRAKRFVEGRSLLSSKGKMPSDDVIGLQWREQFDLRAMKKNVQTNCYGSWIKYFCRRDNIQFTHYKHEMPVNYLKPVNICCAIALHATVIVEI